MPLRRARLLGSSTRWFGAFMALFLLILVWRYEVVTSPPYWDNAIGLWMEANFLVETNFDFARLRNEEKSVWDGGARTYVTSVLPSAVAWLLIALPSTRAVLVAFHLFTFACTAIVVLSIFALVARRIGVVGGLSVSVALVSVPLFNTQLDMVGMEMPLAAGVALCAVAVDRQRFGLATLASLAAFLMKPTGALATLATLAYIGGRLLAGGDAAQPTLKRRLTCGLFASLAVLAIELFLIYLGGTVSTLTEPEHRVMGTEWRWLLVGLPDVTLLVVACGLVSLSQAAAWLLKQPEHGTVQSPHGLLRKYAQALTAEPLLLFSWLMVAGTFLAMARIVFLPRYALVAVPFVYAILGMLVFAGRRRPAFGLIVLGASTVANFANWNGRFFPDLVRAVGPEMARSGGLLERSHEYSADHHSNIAAVRRLVTRCRADTLVVGHPFTHFLAFPRLGYVKEPFRGYSINDFTELSRTLRVITDARIEPFPSQATIVSVGNMWYHLAGRLSLPQPHTDQAIVYNDEQRSPLIVFRLSLPHASGDSSAIDDWYLDRMWPRAPPAERLRLQADFLGLRNRTDEAMLRCRASLQAEPGNLLARQLLANLLLAAGQTDEAVERYLDLFRLGSPLMVQASGNQFSPRVAAARGQAIDKERTRRVDRDVLDAVAELGVHRPLAARHLLETAVAAGRSRAEALLCLGLLATHSGNLNEGTNYLTAALDDDSKLAAARVALGLAYLESGRLAEALAVLEAAVALEPANALAHNAWGLALLRNGQPELALRQFVEARRLDPANVESRQHAQRLRALIRQTRVLTSAATEG